MAVLILMLLAQAGGLNWAATHGDLAAAKAFLAIGADPNYEDNFLQTPLSHAVHEGRGDLVVLLLDSGAKPGIVSFGSTPLHIAVLHNRPDIVSLLLDHTADVNARTRNGELTPLDFAVMQGNLPMTKLLVEHGADVRDGTALHIAASRALTDIARLLLKSGADPNVRDADGVTPVEVAVHKGNREIAELLIDSGAKIPPELFGEAVLRGQQEVLDMLLRKGAGVNVGLASGSTPLHDASLKGYDGIVTLLLARGANVDIRNASGATPLHDAALNGKASVARILLDHGADINAREAESGTTALYAAATLGREEVVALLLEKGAYPNICNNRGASPLHAAIEGGYLSVADRIRAWGGRDQAPVESRNRGVETAKKAVRKAVFFTTNHLTEQLRALGWATTSVAEAAAERIEALEARVLELEAQVARLEGDQRPPA